VKIAVISDIHGNRLALEAVLDDIARQHVDSTLNLGDLVAGPMEPARTADILLDLDIPTIRGNHERYLIDTPPEKLGPVDRFARAHLSERHLAWIRQLPATLSLMDDIFLCHGTPASDEVPWLDNWWDGRHEAFPPEQTVAAAAEGLAFPVLLCGHTHLPRSVRLADGRLIVNPGSVGLQMNHGSPDARYAVLERADGLWSVSLRSVPYDHEAAGAQALANGFPKWQPVLTGGWAGAEGLF